ERPERRGGRQLAANTTPVELPAERLRERLSGLQSGLRRGREQAARPVEARPPTDAPERSDLADTAAWSPTGEEGWRAVRAADRTDPVEFTAAGLPKRQPKARLVPGSVAGKGETASGGRDAGT